MVLATHKSAIKRTKQNEVRNFRNQANRTRVNNVIKSVRAAIDEQAAEKARADLTTAIPVIQKAANKGASHRKNASRKLSRLTRQVNAISG